MGDPGQSPTGNEARAKHVHWGLPGVLLAVVVLGYVFWSRGRTRRARSQQDNAQEGIVSPYYWDEHLVKQGRIRSSSRSSEEGAPRRASGSAGSRGPASSLRNRRHGTGGRRSSPGQLLRQDSSDSAASAASQGSWTSGSSATGKYAARKSNAPDRHSPDRTAHATEHEQAQYQVLGVRHGSPPVEPHLSLPRNASEDTNEDTVRRSPNSEARQEMLARIDGRRRFSAGDVESIMRIRDQLTPPQGDDDTFDMSCDWDSDASGASELWQRPDSLPSGMSRIPRVASEDSGWSSTDDEEEITNGAWHLQESFQIPLFNRLSPETARRLISTMKPMNFKTGDTVITRGTIGTTMYFIDTGTASAMVRDVEATRLGAGDSFGEMSFIGTCRRFLKDDDDSIADTDVIRTADIVATSKCRMLQLSVRNFLMVLSDDPEGNRAVLRALSDIASERKANLERIAQEQKALGRPSSRSPPREKARPSAAAPSKHRPESDWEWGSGGDAAAGPRGKGRADRVHKLKQPSWRPTRATMSPNHVIAAGKAPLDVDCVLDAPAEQRLEVMAFRAQRSANSRLWSVDVGEDGDGEDGDDEPAERAEPSPRHAGPRAPCAPLDVCGLAASGKVSSPWGD